MDYTLLTKPNFEILSFLQTENALDNVRVSIIRPNGGNIPPGSPCDNTKPGDDEWTASLRGHPTSFENLGMALS